MSVVAVMDMGSGTSLLLVARVFKTPLPPKRHRFSGVFQNEDSFVVLKSPSDGETNKTSSFFAEIREDIIHWTRLSEGYGACAYQITPAALKRQARFFKEARGLIKKHGVSRIKCVATEAVRKAENQNQFLKLAQNYGFKVDVLSGEEEATLTARGAVWGLPPSSLSKQALVLDIGGASTELALYHTVALKNMCQWDFTLGRNTKNNLSNLNHRCVSLPLGSVTLTEKYISSFNPPLLEDYKSICDHVQHTLGNKWDGDFSSRRKGRVCGNAEAYRTGENICESDDVFMPTSSRRGHGPGPFVLPHGTVLVVTAGTAATLACLQHQTHNPWRVHGCELSLKQIREWRKKLFSLTEGERKLLPGMPPQRANIILAGVSVLENVMVFFSFRKCVVSVTGLRFGLL